jgi:hypothetical protein
LKGVQSSHAWLILKANHGILNPFNLSIMTINSPFFFLFLGLPNENISLIHSEEFFFQVKSNVKWCEEHHPKQNLAQKVLYHDPCKLNYKWRSVGLLLGNAFTKKD